MNLGKLRRRYTYGRQSLKWFPDDDIIILKATATEKTNNPQESLTIIETILEKKSSDQKH
jgi:hypothetical protein